MWRHHLKRMQDRPGHAVAAAVLTASMLVLAVATGRRVLPVSHRLVGE